MFERLFGRNDDDEEGRTDQRRDGGQPPGDPAAPGQPGQPGQPGDLMAGDDDGEGDGEGADDGPDVGELDVRLGELEEDVDSLESSLRAVRSSQEEFADSIEEMDDRVRRLVGIYDRLNAAENPFVDDPDARARETNGGADTAGGSGGAGPGGPTTPAQTDHAGEEGSVVSFDDLEGGDHGDGDGDGDGDLGRSHEDSSSDGEHPPEGASDGAGADGDGAHAPPSAPVSEAVSDPDTRPVLESVPDSYAGEVLVMEWLSVLMEGSGPADALRAVGHYEDAGWISREVRDHLVDVIGGPTLDVHIDPTQSRESTADEHAISYRYLSVLTQLDDV